MATERAHSIAVKHNIEVAHRLFLLPGKCEQIHGHSMKVTFEVYGELNSGGILNGIEYGDLKKMFRTYLDTEYDHRLLLNVEDPFAGKVITVNRDLQGQFTEKDDEVTLPGVNPCPGDPTTENISAWILDGMKERFAQAGMMDSVTFAECTVWETDVNMARTIEEYTPDQIPNTPL